MGTIPAYETAAGKGYRVRYRRPDHSQTDKRGFETRRSAQLFLASTEVSKSRGEYIEDSAGRATIGAVGRSWLASQTHLKPSAYEPSISPGGFTSPELGSHRDRPHPAQRGAGLGVKDRRILINSARGLTIPRKKNKPHTYLSHDQFDLLATSATHGTVVLTLAYTGLRWGEVTGLRVRDVDLVRRRLAVRKNAVRVGGKILIGTPSTRDGWLVYALNRAREVDPTFPRVTPHDRRHTAASLAVSAGANVKALKRMLGHASAAMTLDVYADLINDDLDSVAMALEQARMISSVGKKWANGAPEAPCCEVKTQISMKIFMVPPLGLEPRL